MVFFIQFSRLIKIYNMHIHQKKKENKVNDKKLWHDKNI